MLTASHHTRHWLVALALTLVSLAGAVGLATPAHAAVQTVSIASGINPSGSGVAVTFTAVASDSSLPASQITGTMTFLDGASTLGTKPVRSGKATLATAKLAPGDHAITAVYAPTSGGAAASSPVLIQHVKPGASTVTLTTSTPAAYLGQAGNVTATVKGVAPALGIPSGSVDFYESGFYLSTAPLNATGKALLPFSALSPGVNVISVTYTGSPGHDASTTTADLTQTILVNVPVAGAAFTPTSVAPGATAKLVISATNTGPTALSSNVALGVLTGGLSATVASMPPGQLCGARSGLIYCLTSVAKGGTSKLTLNITAPTTPGTYTVNAYARNTDTGDETYASATLTVA